MFLSSSNQRSEPTTFTRSRRAVYLAHRIGDGIASQIAPIGQLNYLLNRDLEPAPNDNTPA
jgi:hypothetical protein